MSRNWACPRRDASSPCRVAPTSRRSISTRLTRTRSRSPLGWAPRPACLVPPAPLAAGRILTVPIRAQRSGVASRKRLGRGAASTKTSTTGTVQAVQLVDLVPSCLRRRANPTTQRHSMTLACTRTDEANEIEGSGRTGSSVASKRLVAPQPGRCSRDRARRRRRSPGTRPPGGG